MTDVQAECRTLPSYVWKSFKIPTYFQVIHDCENFARR